MAEQKLPNKAQENEMKREKVRVAPIKYIDDSPDHPFQVRDDEEMMSLVESIATFGVITPVIARIPLRDGVPPQHRQLRYISQVIPIRQTQTEHCMPFGSRTPRQPIPFHITQMAVAALLQVKPKHTMLP